MVVKVVHIDELIVCPTVDRPREQQSFVLVDVHQSMYVYEYICGFERKKHFFVCLREVACLWCWSMLDLWTEFHGRCYQSSLQHSSID